MSEEHSEYESSNEDNSEEMSSRSEETEVPLPDGDDSSDESYIRNAFVNTNLTAQVIKHEKDPEFTLSEKQSEIFYLISTYLGEAVLYSPNVNQSYYTIRKKCSNNRLLARSDDLTQWLHSAFRTAIKKSLSNAGYEWLSELVQKSISEDHENEVSEFFDALLEEKDSLFKLFNRTDLSYAEELCSSAFEIFSDVEIPKKVRLFTVAELIAASRKESEYPALLQLLGLSQHPTNDVLEILRNQGLLYENADQFVDKKTRRDIEKTIRATKNPDPFLIWLIEKLKSKNGNCLIKNELIDSEIVAEKLGLALRSDKGISFDKDKKRFYWSGRSTIMGGLPKTRVLLESPSDKELQKILISEFSSHFIKALSSSRMKFNIHLKREVITLSKPLDIIDGWAMMLANLRLCNRSQKRLIRNREDQIKDVNGDISVVQLFRFNAAPLHQVYDTQDITSTGARRDQVKNLGTYEAICKKIDNIISIGKKDKVDIGQSDIAWWIRCIIQGRKLYPLKPQSGKKLKLKTVLQEDIIEQLVDISYLLFGTEAARNPMALINHQMILDLMIEGHYAFAYFFNWRHQQNVGGGGYAPVSSSGDYAPVSCGRRLNSSAFFGQYFPLVYQYPGPEQVSSTALNEYLSRHHHVMSFWLTKCRSLNKDTPYPEIIDEIIRALSGWYLKIDLSLINTKDLTDKVVVKDAGGYSPTKGAKID